MYILRCYLDTEAQEVSLEYNLLEGRNTREEEERESKGPLSW